MLGSGADPQAEESAVRVERELHVGLVVAPVASATNDSDRSAVHLTGRPIFPAAHRTAVSSW